MVLGGIASGLWIENPKHRTEAVPAGGAAIAGECGHGRDADCREGDLARQPGSEAPEPEPA
jgi:hypothetical protein